MTDKGQSRIKRVKTMDERENQIIQENTAVDFSTKTWKEDITLIVEGKPIYACKQVLALVSPVFNAMFGGDFKERNPEKLEMPGKNHAAFCDFLRCVYPNVLRRVTVSNVHEILPLADEYQVTRLKTECETCLLDSLSKNTSAEDLYHLLLRAYLYNLEILKAAAVALLVEKPQDDVIKASEKVTLPPDAEMDLQKRMVHLLKAKSFKMEEKMKTLTALNGCLAAASHENEIMSEYAKGNWKAGSVEFEVYLKGELLEEVEIRVSKIKFTIKFCKEWNSISVSLNSASDVEYDVRIMGMFIINNWMSGKADKFIFFTQRVSTSSSQFVNNIGFLNELKDETNGYVYHGKIQSVIHILVLDE